MFPTSKARPRFRSLASLKRTWTAVRAATRGVDARSRRGHLFPTSRFSCTSDRLRESPIDREQRSDRQLTSFPTCRWEITPSSPPTGRPRSADAAKSSHRILSAAYCGPSACRLARPPGLTSPLQLASAGSPDSSPKARRGRASLVRHSRWFLPAAKAPPTTPLLSPPGNTNLPTWRLVITSSELREKRSPCRAAKSWKSPLPLKLAMQLLCPRAEQSPRLSFSSTRTCTKSLAPPRLPTALCFSSCGLRFRIRTEGF